MTEAAISKDFQTGLDDLKEQFKAENNCVVNTIPVVIYPDYAEVTLPNGFKKNISIQDFKELITKAIGETQVEEMVETKGMLPPSNMIFYSKTKTELKLSCYYPGGKRILKFVNEGNKKEEFEIIVPNIIISHVLIKDKANTDFIVNGYSKYFCTNLPVSKLPTTFIYEIDHAKGIFLLPMSNTYDGGNMCFGSNSMPARFKDDNYRGLDYYYKFLWDTPFNSDLGIKALDRLCIYNRPATWYKYLNHLSKSETPVFPYFELRGYKDEAGNPGNPSRTSVLSGSAQPDNDEDENDDENWDEEDNPDNE